MMINEYYSPEAIGFARSALLERCAILDQSTALGDVYGELIQSCEDIIEAIASGAFLPRTQSPSEVIG